LEIEDLRTFVEIADAEGITPAAHRLGVSKSIVSRRLVRLEEDLGVQLVARNSRGAGLTEAGITFREYAVRICAEIDSAKETIHPELHVHVSYSDRFVDVIAEGFDCAVRVGRLPNSNLLARRVGPIHGRLVASPEYIRRHGSPETPDELLNHEALMRGTEAWPLMDGDKIIEIRLQGRFKADNGVALVAGAIAGLGLAILPEGLMTEHLASGALVPVMTRYPVAPLAIHVVRPPGQHPSRKIRELTDMMIECFELAPKGAGPATM
jgi:DNA-binding transcriptional LysR family regulator